MADSAIVKAVQDYLAAVRQGGLQARRAILFGSYARGDAHADSDIDVLIIAPEFDGPYDRARVDLLWTLRATTDNRIEPLPVGERQWQEDDASMIIEIARREGQSILLPVARERAALALTIQDHALQDTQSPALDVIELLRAKGADVRYHDPYVPRIHHNGYEIQGEPDLDVALAAADCAVVVTDHSCYDWAAIRRQVGLIVDTRHAVF